MRTYRLEGIARNCERSRFYQWYTDFGPEDPALVHKFIAEKIPAELVARQVVSRNGNNIQFENAVRRGEREIVVTTDINLSPENYSYDALIVSSAMEDRRKYVFLSVVNGTKVIADGVYTPKSIGRRIADALSLFKPQFLKSNQAIMDAFCRAAENEIASTDSS